VWLPQSKTEESCGKNLTVITDRGGRQMEMSQVKLSCLEVAGNMPSTHSFTRARSSLLFVGGLLRRPSIMRIEAPNMTPPFNRSS
jgi:hypothetical protein